MYVYTYIYKLIITYDVYNKIRHMRTLHHAHEAIPPQGDFQTKGRRILATQRRFHHSMTKYRTAKGSESSP